MRMIARSLLILVSAVAVNIGMAMYPPAEIIVDLQKYKLIGVQRSCKFPTEKSEFIEKIEKIYSNLYLEEKDSIKKLDIDKIKNEYPLLLKPSRKGDVISVKFDLLGFVKLFQFNTNLVIAAFDEGSIPFVVKYTLKLQIQKDKEDEIIHNITFSRFLGGNPLIDETFSDIFVHLQNKFCPGQIILTEKDDKEIKKKA